MIKKEIKKYFNIKKIYLNKKINKIYFNNKKSTSIIKKKIN